MTPVSLASLGLGLLTGVFSALAIAACCPEAQDVVWEVSPGTYTINLAVGAAPIHDDTKYQLVVAADGNSAVETYERGGKAFRTEYVLGPGAESPLRSDSNIGHE